MMDNFVDRRKSKRVKVRAPIKIVYGGVTMKGELWNLSSGGALVNMDESLEAYMVIEITIPRLGTLKAAVLTGDPPCSLQFHNMTDERNKEVEDFLNRYELQRKDDWPE